MSSFTFKEFTIQQDRCAIKVGTDGVLLGAWAEAREGHLLDVGTGTGLIAIMLAQRTQTSQICGVEIDAEAASQAQQNVSASPWSERVEVVHDDVFKMETTAMYDEIVSNPPFYTSSPSSSSAARDVARRALPQFFPRLAAFVSRHLKDDGVFEVVLPADVADDFVYMCWEQDLHLKRQTKIYTRQGKPCKRILLAFSRQQRPPLKDALAISDASGAYTGEYTALTRDFYLNV